VYLKSLTLKGFKSFADRTHMVFDPGLTVVVGPNGSGKSNVSDAILWVLGEQSARMLRGQSMEDVIFSGSSARQAVGVAEVTLVLDNSDHTLPIDFDEVGVTRRMYRSGESEYLINGAPARLMDIQDILHDSGLGKETHSIISQGKLDSVLSSKPEERRALIEEAAGISKHKRRKERSQRKLKSMDENLVRAKDISREIARQLRPLERQVDKARRAGEIEARLAELTTTLAVDDLRRLQRAWGEVEARGKEAAAELELARYRVDERQAELERLQSMLEQKGLFVGDLGEQRRRMQDALGRIGSDMRLLEEKGRNMLDRLSEMRMSLSTMERQRTEAQGQLERAHAELAEAQAAHAHLSEEVERLAPEAAAAHEARVELDGRISSLQSRLRRAQHEADQQTLAYHRLQEQVNNAELEDSMFASRLSALEETIATCDEALADRTSRRASCEEALAAARASADEASAGIERANADVAQAAERSHAARAALSEAQATLAALRSVDAAAEASSPLVASVMADEDVSGMVECRLGDLVQAPPELEALVERLLADDLSALVVADSGALSSVASRALEARGESGRAVVVSRGLAAPAHEGGRGTRLVDLLEVADGAAELVEAVLGDVRVVETLDAAVRSHEQDPAHTYATTSGVTVFPDGRVVIGGGTAEGGALERKRRIRALDKSVPKLESALENALATEARANEVLVAARDALASAKGEVARLQGELSSVSAELGRIDAQRSQAANEHANVTDRRAKAAERAAEARGKLDEHHESAELATSQAEQLARELEDVSAGRDQVVEEEGRATQRLSDARLELATVAERQRHLSGRGTELERRVADLDARRAGIERSARALEVLRLRVDPLHARYDAVHECALARAAMLRDRASLAEADSDSLKKTIADARAQVSQAQEALEAAQGSVADAKVAAGRLEVQVENAVAAITAPGAYTLEDALTLPEPEDREAMERDAARLERQLSDIGPVNQVAMEEYETLKARADYINEQVADLERARTALVKITAAIDRKMRRAFLVTFEAVNANFEQVFSVLFPGGRAHLEMTDPDHPADTGVEVVAQPRGKRLAKMTLMSGGEKSLTALALLFAVYRTRTVPFYVFDEVEAALDDSNLNKLLSAIEQLKDVTQLIVISHQRRTMEQADVLYGVSMQADGVSHVVSQRLDRATGKVVDA